MAKHVVGQAQNNLIIIKITTVHQFNSILLHDGFSDDDQLE